MRNTSEKKKKKFIKLKLKRRKSKERENSLPPTNHSLAPPTVPEEIPEVHWPFKLLGSRGRKAISWGLILKAVWPNESATEEVKVHGTVNPPWPSDALPGIAAWIAIALERRRKERKRERKSLSLVCNY